MDRALHGGGVPMRTILLIGTLFMSVRVGAQPLAPPDWDAGLRLAEAADLNPDPRIVEVELRARLAEVEIAGTRVKAWTYNGGIPGPLIRTRVGDRLIVHFTNDLPQPTTVHWHGVRVPIEMDGVPGISQPEVTHGQSFTYDFIVRDAGLYWYHPHVMSAAQVGFGLYGALLVDDPNDGVDVADQLTLVLSDIGFNKKGQLDAPDSGGSAGTVFGREGEYLLVNGKHQPIVQARAGAPQRWRIVNAAKSRFFYLEMEEQSFHVIGGDGGLQESTVTTQGLLVTPGERVDVIVYPTGKPGSSLVVQAALYNRGYGSVEYRIPEDLLTIQFSNQPPLQVANPPKVSRSIAAPPVAGATAVSFQLSLPPSSSGKSDFLVNGVPFSKATPYLARLGERQVWTVTNNTDWDHPFHLHGFFFLVLDEKGAPETPLVWKDTVNVPMKKTVRFVVDFDERPGEWMFHCHILDHADGGLMGTVLVGPVSASEHPHRKP
jgi:FtsP/CotA-like multicopper oxidase with cupredoxin domain